MGICKSAVLFLFVSDLTAN